MRKIGRKMTNLKWMKWQTKNQWDKKTKLMDNWFLYVIGNAFKQMLNDIHKTKNRMDSGQD